MDRRVNIIRKEFGDIAGKAYISYKTDNSEEPNEYTGLIQFISSIYEYVCCDWSLGQLVNSWVTSGLDDKNLDVSFRIFEIDSGIDVSKEKKDFVEVLKEYRRKENV